MEASLTALGWLLRKTGDFRSLRLNSYNRVVCSDEISRSFNPLDAEFSTDGRYCQQKLMVCSTCRDPVIMLLTPAQKPPETQMTMSPNTSPLPDDFEENVHDALSLFHKDASYGSPLDYLTLVKLEMPGAGGNVRVATNHVLLAALDALEVNRFDDAKLLRRRFPDEKSVYIVANELNVAQATVYRKQRLAIARLAETLHTMELAARDQRTHGLERLTLAAGETQLVGVGRHIDLLSGVLLAGAAPWLVSIEGIGGIGKTAIAYQLARRLVAEQAAFNGFAWVSAQQQQFHPGGFIRPVEDPALTAADLIESLVVQLLPAGALPVPFSLEQALNSLKARLRQSACLVVLDNLETFTDVEALLPTLRRLAGPTKFLLTSRQSLHAEPDVFCYPLPGLSEPDSLHLVRAEAQLRPLPHVMAASDDELRPIFETVGGNPLALKLVVGQLYLLDLDQVLDNLRAARGRKAEDMYRYIFQDAWRTLGEDEREVLINMPLFAQNGADFASIEQVSEVKSSALLHALERLVMLSLVNVSGGLHAHRYSIHRLTETFLLTDIIGWPGAGWSDL